METTVVFCKSCQEQTQVLNGFCRKCREMVCIYCGCTDDEPCEDVCCWVADGFCSGCYDGAAQGDFEYDF